MAGKCLMEYLVLRQQAAAVEFPQMDSELTAPETSDSGWETSLPILGNIAPTLSEEVLCSFYAELGAEKDPIVRVLSAYRSLLHCRTHTTLLVLVV